MVTTGVLVPVGRLWMQAGQRDLGVVNFGHSSAKGEKDRVGGQGDSQVFM